MSNEYYNKWDRFYQDESSDEEELEPVQGDKGSQTQSFRLINVPWDSTGEQIRWSMDRIGFRYLEADYPWGLHLFGSLPFSDKKLSVTTPILIREPSEIYKDSATKILVYLYSQGLFSSSFRMYADTNSVDLQEYFDKNLAPASRTIFLNTVLCRWSLTEKYILSTPHLNTWNTAQRVLWPIIYVFLRRTYGINEAAVQDAWKTVDACFDKVDEILKTQGRNHYLIGDSLSAADISFASHAALVLFPNQDDVWADRLTLKTPKLSEIPEELASKIKKLRASAAGSFAIRMYKKERGTSLRQQASKHHSKNNPFWAKSETFRKVAVTVIPALILAVVAIFFTVSFKVQGIILCCILVFSAQLANNWYGPTRVIRLFKELYRLFSIYKTQLKSEESPGMKKGQ